MNTRPPPPRLGPDADVLLADLGRSLAQQLADLTHAPSALRVSSVGALLLALEMRFKLEEQLLLPALHQAGAIDRQSLRDSAAEIEVLRELGDELRGPPDSAPTQDARHRRLRALALAHLGTVDAFRAHGRHGAVVDWQALGTQMREMQERWRQEIARTGDIEDEERDPVGLPPR